MLDMEKMALIPLNGEILVESAGQNLGRKQIDRKGSFIKKEFKDRQNEPRIYEYKAAMDVKQKLVNPKAYQHEKGFIPEKYLWMQLTFLLAKEKPVLMDYENNNWRGTYLMECYNFVSGLVTFAHWYDFPSQLRFGGKNPSHRDDHYGVRSLVDIKK